jgi:uncharacterized membrane protein
LDEYPGRRFAGEDRLFFASLSGTLLKVIESQTVVAAMGSLRKTSPAVWLRVACAVTANALRR